ncbi:hypothetical protein DSO57_1012658 [Entomophthora muscae]|uniref:Uncharacterized protein n=1 Tax=Entomophthora muscae TaxID=34485 RepID=A0ACC2RX75_9FUNG|nr:hypothetical protein DSO57_1012658 [Entomophthora muscae]
MSFILPESPLKSPLKSPVGFPESTAPEKFKLLVKTRQASQKTLSSSQVRQIQKLFERVEEAEDSPSLEKNLVFIKVPFGSF